MNNNAENYNALQKAIKNNPEGSGVKGVIDAFGNIIPTERLQAWGRVDDEVANAINNGDKVYHNTRSNTYTTDPIPQMSIKLDKKTGKITVKAPKDFIDSGVLQDQLKNTLSMVSSGYKTSGDNAKYTTTSGETVGTDDILKQLQDGMPEVYNAYRAYKNQNARDKEAYKFDDETASKIDNDFNYSRIRNAVALGEDASDKTLQAIPNLEEFSFLKNLETYDEGTGTVQLGDLKEHGWTRVEHGDEELRNANDALKKYFADGDYSDTSELARNIAMYEYINGGEKPNVQWYRAVGDFIGNFVRGIGNESVDLGGIIYMGASALFGAVESGSQALGRGEGFDVDLQKSEIWKTYETAMNMWATDKQKHADYVGFLSNSDRQALGLGEGVTTLVALIATGNIMSDLAKGAIAGAGGALTTAIDAMGNSSKMASFLKSGVQVITGIADAEEIATIFNISSEAANLAIKVGGFGTLAAGLIAETFGETLVANPDLYQRVINSGQLSDTAKDHLAYEFAQNAGGMVLGVGVGKALMKAGDTATGRILTQKGAKQIAKIQNKFEDLQNALRFKWYHVDDAEELMSYYIGRATDASGSFSQQRWEAKARALFTRENLRVAKNMVANMDTIQFSKYFMESKEDILKEINDAQKAITNVEDVNNAIDEYLRQGRGIFSSMFNNKRYHVFQEAASELSGVSDRIRKAERAAGLVGQAGKNTISQETANYVDAIIHRDIAKNLADATINTGGGTTAWQRTYEKLNDAVTAYETKYAGRVELLRAAQEYVVSARKASNAAMDVLVDMGAKNAADIAAKRASGIWGENGELYAITQRIPEFSDKIFDTSINVVSEQTYRGTMKLVPGADGDFLDPAVALRYEMQQQAASLARSNVVKAVRNADPSSVSTVADIYNTELARKVSSIKKDIRDRQVDAVLNESISKARSSGVFNILSDKANAKGALKTKKGRVAQKIAGDYSKIEGDIYKGAMRASEYNKALYSMGGDEIDDLWYTYASKKGKADNLPAYMVQESRNGTLPSNVKSYVKSQLDTANSIDMNTELGAIRESGNLNISRASIHDAETLQYDMNIRRTEWDGVDFDGAAAGKQNKYIVDKFGKEDGAEIMKRARMKAATRNAELEANNPNRIFTSEELERRALLKNPNTKPEDLYSDAERESIRAMERENRFIDSGVNESTMNPDNTNASLYYSKEMAYSIDPDTVKLSIKNILDEDEVDKYAIPYLRMSGVSDEDISAIESLKERTKSNTKLGFTEEEISESKSEVRRLKKNLKEADENLAFYEKRLSSLEEKYSNESSLPPSDLRSLRMARNNVEARRKAKEEIQDKINLKQLSIDSAKNNLKDQAKAERELIKKIVNEVREKQRTAKTVLNDAANKAWKYGDQDYAKSLLEYTKDGKFMNGAKMTATEKKLIESANDKTTFDVKKMNAKRRDVDAYKAQLNEKYQQEIDNVDSITIKMPSDSSRVKVTSNDIQESIVEMDYANEPTAYVATDKKSKNILEDTVFGRSVKNQIQNSYSNDITEENIEYLLENSPETESLIKRRILQHAGVAGESADVEDAARRAYQRREIELINIRSRKNKDAIRRLSEQVNIDDEQVDDIVEQLTNGIVDEMTTPTTYTRTRTLKDAETGEEITKTITTGTGEIARGIDALVEYSGADPDIARRYYALQAYYDNRAEYKKKLNEQLKKEFKEANAGEMVKVNTQDRVAHQMTEEIMSRLDDQYAEVYSMMHSMNPELPENGKMFDEAEKLASDIRGYQSDHNQYVVIQGPDGKMEVVRTNPLLGSFVQHGFIHKPMGSLSRLNYMSNKLFRANNTSLWIKSQINQMFRDSTNAVIGGTGTGFFKSFSKSMNQDVYGESVVDWIRRSDQGLADDIAEAATQTGKTENEIAIQYLKAEGAAISPQVTETNVYREAAEKNIDFRTLERVTGRNGEKIISETAYNRSNAALNKVIDTLGTPNELRETGIRNKVYQSALADAFHKGYSYEDAKKHAQFLMDNATTNFGRQYEFLSGLQQTIPFLGAAINGTTSFWRLVALDPVGVFGRFIGGLAIPTLGLTAMSLNSEENIEAWKNLKEYEKEDSLVFINDGQIISIPMPHEIMALINPFRSAVETMYGANTHTFGQLLVNDLLGLSPITLTGLSDIDANVMTDNTSQDHHFLDNLGTEMSALAAQLLPAWAKTIVMGVTGKDPYTGKKIDTSYTAMDYDSGERTVMGDYAGKFAHLIKDMAKGVGWDLSAPTVEALMEGLFGSASISFGNYIVDIGQNVVSSGVGGLGQSLLSIGEDVTGLAGDALTVNQYRTKAQADWRSAIGSLWTKKEELLNKDEWKSAESNLRKALLSGTEDDVRRARAVTQNLSAQFYSDMKQTIDNLVNVYGEEFTEEKYASILSLAVLNDVSTGGTSSVSQQLKSNMYKDSRNSAIHTLQRMGFTGASDYSIMGYFKYSSETGEIYTNYATPLAILDARNTVNYQKTLHAANIKTILERNDLTTSSEAYQEMIDARRAAYDRKDYDAADAIAKEWDAKVMIALFNYIDRTGAETVLQYNDVIDELKHVIRVPSSYEKTNKGRSIGKSDRLSEQQGFVKSYINYVYNRMKKGV